MLRPRCRNAAWRLACRRWRGRGLRRPRMAMRRIRCRSCSGRTARHGAMNTSRLAIEYMPLAALRPYEHNARTHSAEQVAQIAASIRTFGWTNPVLADETNTVIAGHGRIAAAANIGLEQVPVIRLAGLTEQQRRALTIA